MLNWISSACIVQAGQAGPLYVNTPISMAKTKPSVIVLKVGSAMTSTWPLIILLNLNFFG